MSYHPIHDMWFLARAKLKDGSTYYGAYMGGFLERARLLIGCSMEVPMLHVCGGKAREYPYRRGFGINDRTMDLNPECKPDFLMDCREKEWPKESVIFLDQIADRPGEYNTASIPWGGILIDSAYSEEDQTKYGPEVQGKYPKPNELVRTAINTLRVGYRVGIIHYIIPQCPKNAQFVACVGTVCGFNNRIRAFSVYERITL